MTENYFTKFPQISYSNNSIVDITKRCAVVKSVYNNPFLYSPLDIANGVRPDQIAYDLYKEPYLDWQIFLSNKIVDPYYEWYLSQDDLDQSIANKYGSTAEANSKILHYRVNFQSHLEDKISVDEFNVLGTNEFKYWEPVVFDNKIAFYKRKELYWNTTTNGLIRYQLSRTSGLSIGDILKLKINDLTYGYGEIIYIEGNYVTLKNVHGECYEHDDIEISDNSYCYVDDESLDIIQTYIPLLNFIPMNNYRTIIGIEVVNWTIPLTEAKYWEPVSAYEYESEKNEYNRSIRILSNNYLGQFISDTQKALNG